MKLYIFLLFFVSTAFTKPIKLQAEKFECIANYLRDKGVLDKNFKYFVQSQPLDCESLMKDLPNTIIESLFNQSSPSSTSSEEDDETKVFRNLTRSNSECLKEQLMAVNYADQIMKVFVYSKSNKLSRKDKKKLVAEAENDGIKKFKVAASICLSSKFFGEMFDEIMKEDLEEYDEQEKQNDYCVRKYAVDKNLIDTTKYEINLNPNNIELNFNCDDMIEDLLEATEETMREDFESDGYQIRKQRRCLNKTIKDEEIVDYIIRISVLSELSLNETETAEMRKEFIEKIQNFYQQMVKCY